MRKIKISTASVEALAELNDTRTADAVWDALPFSINGSTWGDEIYFAIPVTLPEENPRAVVELGDLGYWPPGHAFCIFFGPTPASRAGEIRPASPVNLIGRVLGDPLVFRQVQDGQQVTVEPVV